MEMRRQLEEARAAAILDPSPAKVAEQGPPRP